MSHSAADWRDVLEPVIAHYRGRMKRRYFRADAAFASPEIYEVLEAEGYKYTIRLPANAVLQQSTAWLLKRPVGRPPHEGHPVARTIVAPVDDLAGLSDDELHAQLQEVRARLAR